MTPPATLTIFVPAKLVNPLNGAHGHWTKTAKRRQTQRDALALAIFKALGTEWALSAPPEQPKRVTFTLHVSRLFDDDALGPICKSYRDELVTLGFLSGDGPNDPHVFTYTQRVAKPTGVEITVELA